MDTIKELHGVIPALITPFDENEALDENRLRAVTRELLEEQVNGLYITGSTGECFMMTEAERCRVVEVVMEEAGGKVPVIAHIGDIGSRNSIALAKEAQRLGVDAISSVPPFYWKFKEEEILRYYRDLAESTSLPFIIYNIPMAGLLSYSLLKQLAAIPNVVGIKYTTTTHYELNLLRSALGKDFKLFSGCDEMGLSGLLFGADGLIGSFYNLMPELYVSLYRAVQQGDMTQAAQLQKEADLIIDLALEYSYVSVIKMAMGWKGADGGYCRRPFNDEHIHEQEIKDRYRALRDQHQIRSAKFLNGL